MSALPDAALPPINLAALAPVACWVAWQQEERESGKPPTKMPYAPRSGMKAKADDPTTWATRAEAEAYAARLLKPFGLGGVGMELCQLDDGRGIGGVDLDTCRGADGTLAPWAAEVIDRLASYTEVSPSGGGVKVFFQYTPADLPTLQTAMSTRYSKMFKQRGEGEHPPAIELHLGNRYFAVTDQHLAGTPAELRPVSRDTLLWLIREAGPRFVGIDGKTASKSTDDSRSARAFRRARAARLNGAAASFDQMVDVLLTDPETASWVEEKGEANDRRELRRIWERTADHDAGAAFAAVPLPEGATDGGPGEPPPPAPGGNAKDDDLPMRDLVINALLDVGVAFWRDADGAAFCTVPRGEAVQRYRVRSRAFCMVARRVFGAANQIRTKTGWRPGSVSDAVMAEVLPALEAITLDGPCRVPDVRVVEDSGAIWLDLCDESWRAVRVTADGWQVLERADVPLIRPEGMRPLPAPVRDPAAMARLRGLVNLPSAEHDASFKLTVAWLVAALFPRGPYCVLAIDGEQGSGKSTTARMLRRLVDSNAADLRATPRSEDDLLIAAQNGRVTAFDNVSYIEPDMADALCRVATGAGFGKRKLYTDGDEIIVNVCRPVLLNGIPSLLARGDLADRSIALTLPTIPDAARRDEADVWAAFDAAAPGVLAALLDGLATALRRLPTLRLAAMPRMADFARLACAAAPAFGWTQDDMLAAILANRETAVATVIEADPVAGAVSSLAAEAGAWTGTATALLALVNQRVPLEVLRERAWPKDATRLAARIKRVAPALRRAGVDVTTRREGRDGQRTILIRRGCQGKSSESASAASAASALADSCGFPADAAPPYSVSPSSAERQQGSGAGAADARLTLTESPASDANPRKSAIADGADATDAVLPNLPKPGVRCGPAGGDHGAFAAPGRPAGRARRNPA